jgi:hypothetical protein
MDAAVHLKAAGSSSDSNGNSPAELLHQLHLLLLGPDLDADDGSLPQQDHQQGANQQQLLGQLIQVCTHSSSTACLQDIITAISKRHA